jgi:antitoxin HigA-1
LVEEFLTPMGLTQVRFAECLNVPLQRVNEIATGKRGVTPETALLFAAALRTSPEFWLNLQTSHELAKARSRAGKMPKALEGVSRQLVAFAATRRATAVVHKKK